MNLSLIFIQYALNHINSPSLPVKQVLLQIGPGPVPQNAKPASNRKKDLFRPKQALRLTEPGVIMCCASSDPVLLSIMEDFPCNMVSTTALGFFLCEAGPAPARTGSC